jgi:type II secretory pathway pseudopilin PulG
MIMKSLAGFSSSRAEQAAFTLTELLVVLVTITLLAAVFLPAHAASRPKSQSVRCMDNFRELMRAVMLYTRDNHDLFPPNEDTSSAPAGHVWVSGDAGVSGAQQFNPDVLANPTLCLITTYINTNVSLFHCPADLRVGLYQGTDPGKIGTKVPAARSVVLNGAVGTSCPGFDSGGHSGKPVFSVNGRWLDNTGSHRRNSPWRTYGKVSETMIPGPAKLSAIMEEDIYSINDATFAFGMNTPEWIDFPGTRHGMGGVFAFVDGNVELHKWVEQSTRVIGGNVIPRTIPAGHLTDWVWLKERTSERAQ